MEKVNQYQSKDGNWIITEEKRKELFSKDYEAICDKYGCYLNTMEYGSAGEIELMD